MARDLQTAFLPSHYPVFPVGAPAEQSVIRFCHRYYATKELGGDFFDILQVSDTEAGIFVCDVMGHGVRATLVTAIVRGLVAELRSIAADAGAFLTAINQALCSILRQPTTPLLASAFYAIADVAKGEVRFANAGHPAAFHVRRAAGLVEPLRVAAVKPSPVLGVIENATYPGAACPLEPGDLILLFTDSLYELESPTEEFYDAEQLRAAVARRLAMPTPQLLDELLVELKTFGREKTFADDVCVVAIDIAEIVKPLAIRPVRNKSIALSQTA